MRDKAMAKEVEVRGQSYSWKGGLQMGRKSQGGVSETLHWLKLAEEWMTRRDSTYKSRTLIVSHAKKTVIMWVIERNDLSHQETH